MSTADLYQYCFVIFGLGLRLKLKVKKRMLAKSRLNIWWVVSDTMLLRMTTNTNLVVVSVARVAGDGEVLQQVNAVIFIISTQSSFQKSLPVVVIPARHKEAEASH